MVPEQKRVDPYRAIVENSVDAIALVAADGRILLVTSPIERLTGYRPDELVGQGAFDLVHPDDSRHVRDAFQRALETREPVRIEYRGRHKNGSWRHRDVIGINRLDDPAVRGVVVNFRDTTVGSLAEEALLERERRTAERLRAVISTVPIVLWAIDRDGRVTLSEGNLLHKIGLEPGQVVGRSIFSLYQDMPEVLEFTRAALRGDSPAWTIAIHGTTFSGCYTPLRNAAGTVTGAIGVATDVSERTQLEQKLRQMQKMEAVGRLAGGIAHDFNNLLTAIVGYAELALAQVPAREPLFRDLDQIRNAGQSAASLTRQLLAFSRKQLLQPELIDLNAIVARTTELLRRLIGEHIDLRSRPTEPLDRVSADPGQIEQVILNLALNARDAMPRGGILSIETANVELDTAYVAGHPGARVGAHVMLAISDTGIGMSRAAQEHLFEPFYTTKELGQGTGLGLATVYGIVKQSGGSIFVSSEIDRGTLFKVFLPRAESGVERSDTPPPIPTELQGTETILLVEDQPEVRSVVEDILVRNGYTVLVASSGEEALQAARTHGRIDLLVSDLVMPSMRGRDLGEQLRGEFHGVRALYMSGYTADSAVQRDIIDNSVPFIQKPFTPNALLQKIREILSFDAPPGAR